MHFQINPLAYKQTYTAVLSPFYKGSWAGMGRPFPEFLLTTMFVKADL